MKLKFKKQAYQTLAVESVIDCFVGQPRKSGINYRIDTGIDKNRQQALFEETGFKNGELALSAQQILENIQTVQRRQNLPLSPSLVQIEKVSNFNLDVEMETGTGKTYCYIKTIFEMYERYGWSKFIIVVPSIAIREGIYKSLEITAEHFQETYHKKAKYFIYNSKQLHNLESFSSDAGINIMVINVQAFNARKTARGKDQRRIYEELDDFQSRKPIDVISANRPILILDEPQKMEGKKTMEALKEFNALFILRYSATHKTEHNKVHRLDALDAYKQKLVKKIAVRGISVKGLPGTNAYLYLESIEVSRHEPVARMEFEVKQKHGIKRIMRKFNKGDKLFELSGGLEQYKGFVVNDINAHTDTIDLTNGKILKAGEATGDVNEMALRRIQIRETIRAHFEKEEVLFHKGIKVLSLFFIDEVARYRMYTDEGETGGEYAKIFEEEYMSCLAEVKENLYLSEEYRKYLNTIQTDLTHNGYFSIDKKGRMVDSKETGRGADKECNDVDAYDLILKDKERLLSFEEPTRFIFSHSALREGWDNPNVFVICTLKHSDNTISRRQEVGRGLRIAVDQHGERQDHPDTVHQTNVLTVVASESYKDFVTALQRDIVESLSKRPSKADVDYFKGKVLMTESGSVVVTEQMAKQITRYLIQNDYTDLDDHIAQEYLDAQKNNTLAPLPHDLAPYQKAVYQLIDSVFTAASLPTIEDDRGTKTNPLNNNFEKKEFKALWQRINRKAVYTVHFDSNELIRNCIDTLDKELKVSPMRFTIELGEQLDDVDYEQLDAGKGFKVKHSRSEFNRHSIQSVVTYDLIGKLASNVTLTRKTIAKILTGISKETFNKFKINPESFISEASRLITEQKATAIIEHLSYNSLSDTHSVDIFTDAQTNQDFSRTGEKMKKHIYDYVVTDSKVERDFVENLDTSSEVVVYAKLPRGFAIPTPVGNYNPDWAISFKEGEVKHIYFVAETKGSISSMELREVEKTRIECARKFFNEINKRIDPELVKYDVVDSYDKLMDIVKPG